jgi:hypothetical protein
MGLVRWRAPETKNSCPGESLPIVSFECSVRVDTISNRLKVISSYRYFA